MLFTKQAIQWPVFMTTAERPLSALLSIYGWTSRPRPDQEHRMGGCVDRAAFLTSNSSFGPWVERQCVFYFFLWSLFPWGSWAEWCQIVCEVNVELRWLWTAEWRRHKLCSPLYSPVLFTCHCGPPLLCCCWDCHSCGGQQSPSSRQPCSPVLWCASSLTLGCPCPRGHVTSS